MQVGLFFGSFNPVHVGHLILAQALLNETELDQVWLVISPQNPFKEKKGLLNAADRYRLVELATEGHEAIFPSNVEFSLPQPSYTVDTMNKLAEDFPSYDFSLLMGEDNLAGLHKWKKHEVLLAHYPIYVYPRFGAPEVQVSHANIRRIDAPRIELSATAIRQLLAAGKPVDYYVPAPALAYILQHNLYR